MKKCFLFCFLSLFPLVPAINYSQTMIKKDKENPKLTLGIDERWFHAIKTGKKSIEGRQGNLQKGCFKGLSSGDKIKFISSNQEMTVTVLAVRHYPTLNDYLLQEGLRKTLPGVHTLTSAKAIYHQYYSDSSIAKNGGMLAIELYLDKMKTLNEDVI